MQKSKISVRTIAGMAMLTALVVVLQLIGAYIPKILGLFSVSLVLIPIVIGAALYGWLAGGFLGFVFGVVVLVSGDAALFLGYSAIGTIITVLAKGTAAGMITGLVFQALSKLHPYVRALIAAVVCPVVNTGVFLIGCELFFMPHIEADFGVTNFWGLIVTMVGLNFVFELALNVILNPIIVRVLDALKLTRKHS